jgi:hypothetical protein
MAYRAPVLASKEKSLLGNLQTLATGGPQEKKNAHSN